MDILNNKDVKYDAKFTSKQAIKTFDDHVEFIKEKSTRLINVDGNTVSKWAGDFYGLLNVMGVNPNAHYITARINGLNSSNDDFSEFLSIRMPDEPTLQLIFSKIK